MKSLRILIAAIMMMSVTACSARYLRQAQDEFSRGAQMENAAFVRGYEVDIRHLSQDPAAAYRISLSLVNRELDKNENALRQDKLYGTALMLKAMCLWRLASGGELITVIQETTAAYKAGQIVLGERDLAMLNALPGLRDHDLALQAETYEDAEKFFKSALDVVKIAAEDAKLVPPGSQMGIYLRLAMLSTCRAWQFAAYSFHADDLGTAKEKAKEPRKRAKELFKELEPLTKADKQLGIAIKNMKFRMGI